MRAAPISSNNAVFYHERDPTLCHTSAADSDGHGEWTPNEIVIDDFFARPL